jgi:S1-C subfamily serine protease
VTKLWVATMGILAMAPLAGCGLVPPAPTVTSSASNSSTAPQTTTASDPASPAVIGFTEFERAALRVRNVGCGTVATGSGFAISDHAFITNRHVIGGANLLQVSTFDGTDVEVTTAGAAVMADLAVVRTVQTLPATVRVAEADPAVGAAVTAVGFPLGGPLTTSHGKVLGYGKDPVGWSSLPMLLNDAPVEHGSSGSALLNDDGELVGVVYALTGPGSGYAVPVEILNKLLQNPSAYSESAPCGGAPASSPSASSDTTCSPTVTAGPTTSCAFALNVESAWLDAGGGTTTVDVYSPVTKKTYAMRCEQGTPTVCQGGNNAVVYIWVG